MDPRQFDDLVKRLSRTISRRKVLGGSVGTSLGAVTAAAAAAAAAVEDVFAKGDGKKQHAAGKGKGGKKNRGPAAGQGKKKKKGPGKAGAPGGTQTEQCVATGQRCGPPDCNAPRGRGKKKGKGKGKGNPNRCKPCSKCCSRHSVPAERAGRRCACRPNGFACNPANPAQCCSAVCDPARGVCTDRFVS